MPRVPGDCLLAGWPSASPPLSCEVHHAPHPQALRHPGWQVRWRPPEPGPDVELEAASDDALLAAYARRRSRKRAAEHARCRSRHQIKSPSGRPRGDDARRDPCDLTACRPSSRPTSSAQRFRGQASRPLGRCRLRVPRPARHPALRPGDAVPSGRGAPTRQNVDALRHQHRRSGFRCHDPSIDFEPGTRRDKGCARDDHFERLAAREAGIRLPEADMAPHRRGGPRACRAAPHAGRAGLARGLRAISPPSDRFVDLRRRRNRTSRSPATRSGRSSATAGRSRALVTCRRTPSACCRQPGGGSSPRARPCRSFDTVSARARRPPVRADPGSGRTRLLQVVPTRA